MALLNRSRRWNCTCDVLAGTKGGYALWSMQVDWRIDVDRVNSRVLDQLVEIFEPFTDVKLISNFVQLASGPLADRVHIRVGVVLVDRNEFLTKAQSDDRYI